MGKKLEPNQSMTVTPGPGAYRAEESFSKQTKGTEAPIGTAQRTSFNQKGKQGFPGPGQHSPETKCRETSYP